MEEQSTIWTIGHSTRSFEVFAALLAEAGITLVADIRAYAGSRRFPQYNRLHLEALLQERGIGYVHLPELGGRRKPRKDSPNTAWRNAAFRGYADYMQTAAFGEAIARLQEMGRKQRTAYLCSEATWWNCHRSLVSDYLKAAGWRVLHLLDRGQQKEHPYTAPARLIDGKLSYPDDSLPFND